MISNASLPSFCPVIVNKGKLENTGIPDDESPGLSMTERFLVGERASGTPGQARLWFQHDDFGGEASLGFQPAFHFGDGDELEPFGEPGASQTVTSIVDQDPNPNLQLSLVANPKMAGHFMLEVVNREADGSEASLAVPLGKLLVAPGSGTDPKYLQPGSLTKPDTGSVIVRIEGDSVGISLNEQDPDKNHYYQLEGGILYADFNIPKPF